jgi:hypothetical protein
MAPKKAAKRQKSNADVVSGSADELARIIVLDLKYRVPQAVLVHDLTKAGLGPTRIAELLGTTPGTVNITKRRKRPKWPK